jgi:hypothetical protein
MSKLESDFMPYWAKNIHPAVQMLASILYVD